MNRILPRKLVCCALLVFSSCMLHAQIKGNPQIKKTPSPANSVPKSFSPLSSDLVSLYQSKTARRMARLAKPSAFKNNGLSKFIRTVGDRVLVDVTIRGDEQQAMSELQKTGFVATATWGKMVSGSIPISSLPQLESLPSLKYAMPAYKPRHLLRSIQEDIGTAATKTGPVISQGDTAQRSNIARNKYRVDGKGVLVGVLSDSYNHLGGAAAGVLHGELPGVNNPYGYKKPVHMQLDDTSGTDEGRAMLEIVHDVAPGAELAFHTAEGGQAAFAKGIYSLYNVGCKVIADDILYFAEPFYQDGVPAQAVDRVKEKGVAYFSAAGNSSIRSYESDYRPTHYAPFGEDAGTAHNFSGAGDVPRYFQPIYIPTGGLFIASFQWDNPFYSASNGHDSATTDFDIYLLNDTGAVVAGGGADNIASGDPVEVFGYQNNDSTNQTFYLLILKYSGPDVHKLKYILFGDGAFYLTNPAIPGILAPALVGHPKAAGAISTAAAFYLQTPAYGTDTAVVEPFSSEGGVPNYFAANGKRIAPLIRKKPDITAPDGGNTSFFDPFGNGDIPEDSDHYPNFFGTSAATPHAAGVAALMIQAQKLKTITPAQISGILSASALDMDDPYTDGFDKGYDFATGNGFIRADAAVGAVKFPRRYIQDLKAEAVCSNDPSNTRNWRIVNPNPFDIKAHWLLVGFNQQGDITVPAGGSYSFTTKTEYYYNHRVPNVLIADWEDNFGFTRFKIVNSNSTKCGMVASAATLDEDTVRLDKNAMAVAEVYPNPFASSFRLYLSLQENSNAEIQLMTVDGRKLMARTVAGQGVFTIDASSYKPGVYLLQVTQGTFNKVIKLIKQ